MTAPTHLPRRALLGRAAAAMLAPWAAAASTSSQAQTAGPTATPPTAAQSLPAALLAELPGLQLRGSARMRFWGLNIYDARLWVAEGFAPGRYAQSPFALELQYLRSLSGKAIAERSLAEMQRLGPIAPEQGARWQAAMEQAFPDVKAGDRIVGAHTPDTGARFWYNGQARPAIADAAFSRLFFGIWLAEATSEPGLRKQLLGLAPP